MLSFLGAVAISVPFAAAGVACLALGVFHLRATDGAAGRALSHPLALGTVWAFMAGAVCYLVGASFDPRAERYISTLLTTAVCSSALVLNGHGSLRR